MRAVAIKKSSREKTAAFQEMGTLRCDDCREEFFIGHSQVDPGQATVLYSFTGGADGVPPESCPRVLFE
jgi:hypothetical protein